jgi:hypothetical protein
MAPSLEAVMRMTWKLIKVEIFNKYPLIWIERSDLACPTKIQANT